MTILGQQAVNFIDRAITEYLSEQGITRGQLAETLGMSTNTLRWKRQGKYEWTWGEILALSEIVGKSPDELAGMSEIARA